MKSIPIALSPGGAVAEPPDPARAGLPRAAVNTSSRRPVKPGTTGKSL